MSTRPGLEGGLPKAVADLQRQFRDLKAQALRRLGTHDHDEAYPLGRVGYTTYETASTAVSGTGDGTELMTVDVNLDSGRRYRISGHVRYRGDTTDDRQAKQTVYVDGSAITTSTELVNQDATDATKDIYTSRETFTPSTTGTHTISLNALRYSGPTSLIAQGSSGVPGELMVEDIGAA